MWDAQVDFSRPWTEQSFVAFDLEATGPYPLTSEIVEFGAVRWEHGEIRDELHFLVKPSHPMSDFIIGIHGITNEMVQDQPAIHTQIDRVRQFLRGSVLLAHHATFDMGFLAVDLDATGLPNQPTLCTSRLAQALIKETPNHRLQTLTQHFGINPGRVHRAVDDARSCMLVGLECFRRLGQVAVGELAKPMNGFYDWQRFSVRTAPEMQKKIAQAVRTQKDIEMIYTGGSLKGKTRRATPKGLVRTPEGDWMPALCHIDRAEKRFYLNKISDLQIT